MITVETLGDLTFDGDVIRYRSIKVRGGLRTHIHEYPHSPGGAPEKLGRKLYEVTVSGIVLADTGDSTTAWGQSAWPDKLNRMMLKFDEGKTGDLHLPHIGTMRVYAENWERDLAVARTRNGEDLELLFREDQSEKFMVANIIQTAQTGLIEKASTFSLESAKISPRPTLFDQILKAVASVQAIFDQIDIWDAVLVSKLEALTAILQDADKRLDELNDPANYELLNALHELWAATLDVAANVAEVGVLLTWTVPQSMSVAEASVGIYHDASRAMDLMQLNALEDPYNLRAGTTLKYLEAA